MSTSALLLLADGRFPAGGHAHSLITEPAIEHGLITDEASLRSFLSLRLATTGLLDASFCAHATSMHHWSDAEVLDVEYEARTLSAKTRSVSRQLGRQLIDTAAGVWPESVRPILPQTPSDSQRENIASSYGEKGWHHPIAFGLVASSLGISPEAATSAVLYQFATTITSAVVRLLGLDPVVSLRIVAEQPLDDLNAKAMSTLDDKPAELPSLANPFVDILAEDHNRWDMKLFAS